MKKFSAAIIDTYGMQKFARYAIEKTLELDFIAKIYTFSDKPIIDGEVFIKINPITSLSEYNNFIINCLPHFVDDDYLLIIQWDGFPLNREYWRDYFLKYDYIGAVWPGVPENIAVGNGGFSLRSRFFLEASRNLLISSKILFDADMAEDLFLCSANRDKMEKDGIYFPPVKIANEFSYESRYIENTFGFHGAFNLPNELSEDFLISNSQELLDRTKRPDMLARLILNSKFNNKIDFLKKIVNEINQDKNLSESVRNFFKKN